MLNVGPLPLAARPCACPQPPASFLPSGSTPPSLQPRGLVTEACPGMLFPSVVLGCSSPLFSAGYLLLILTAPLPPSCSLPFCPPPGRGPSLLSPDFFFCNLGSSVYQVTAIIHSARTGPPQSSSLPQGPRVCLAHGALPHRPSDLPRSPPPWEGAGPRTGPSVGSPVAVEVLQLPLHGAADAAAVAAVQPLAHHA